MKSTFIYGVDVNKKITPIIVRDAIIKCFAEAHCDDANIGQVDENTIRKYCQEIVKKAFSDSGNDFNNPTKQSLISCINNLAEFAKNFRDPSVIKKHYQQIMVLINQLSE